jgi:hypothetical protein
VASGVWYVCGGAVVTAACVAEGVCWEVVHPAMIARKRTSTEKRTKYPGSFMIFNTEESYIWVTVLIGEPPP